MSCVLQDLHAYALGIYVHLHMVNIKNAYHTFNWLPVHSIKRMNICINMNMLVDGQKQQKGIVQPYNFDDSEEVGMGVF